MFQKKYFIKKNKTYNNNFLKKNKLLISDNITDLKNKYLKNKFNNIFKNESKCLKCSICLESTKKEIITLKCNHSFHKNCIQKWFKTDSVNLSCPLCRRKNSSIFNTNLEIINNVKNYKIYIDNFKDININLINSNKCNIFNINIKNIVNLIDYNQAYNLIVPFKNNEMGEVKLFEVNGIKVTHFLRNIILFGSDNNTIDVIEKTSTNNQKYLTVNEDYKLYNYNKIIFNNLYNYCMQILNSFEKIKDLNFKVKNKCLLWDLCFNFQLTTNKSFTEIFKLFIINLIKNNKTNKINNIEKVYTETTNKICNHHFNTKLDMNTYYSLKDDIKYILNNSEKLNIIYYKYLKN